MAIFLGTKGEVIRITGKMGDVMKESTEIAYTFVFPLFFLFHSLFLNTQQPLQLCENLSGLSSQHRRKCSFARF